MSIGITCTINNREDEMQRKIIVHLELEYSTFQYVCVCVCNFAWLHEYCYYVTI